MRNFAKKKLRNATENTCIVSRNVSFAGNPIHKTCLAKKNRSAMNFYYQKCGIKTAVLCIIPFFVSIDMILKPKFYQIINSDYRIAIKLK